MLSTKVPQIPQVPIFDEEIPSRDLWDLWDGRDLWDIPCPTLSIKLIPTYSCNDTEPARSRDRRQFPVRPGSA